jgi:hypothetical protein
MPVPVLRPDRRPAVSLGLLLALLVLLSCPVALAADVDRECASAYADTGSTLSTGQVTKNVTSLVRPLKGVMQRDADFGTCLFRATDHVLEPPTSFARNDYSRRQAFNADNTRFVVYASGGGWHLYDANSLAWIRQLSGISGTAEAQWHATDPNVLYYVPNKGGMKLYRLDVASNTSTVAADFTGKLPWSNVARVWQKGEGSPSADGRYWCFAAETSTAGILGVFTYDLQSQAVVGSKSLSVNPNWVSMSPSGRYCLVAGTTAYNATFTSSRTLLSGSQHSDLALGADGHDYFVFINQAVDGYVTMIDIDTGTSTRLVPTWINGSATSGHLSAKAFSRPGWVLYSTFNSKNGEQWVSERLLAIEMKASPKIINLARHHSFYNGYWTQPHATVSRDFSRVVFNSNWGSTSDMDVDTYLVRLPDDAFGAPPPPTTPPPTTDTIAPSVSASSAANARTVTLTATASDNVGVAAVDFIVDGVLRGTDSSAPYSLTLSSGKLGSGSHSLVAVAYDKAANAGQSAPVAFGVKTKLTKTSTTTQLLAMPTAETSSSPTAPRVRLGRRAGAD